MSQYTPEQHKEAFEAWYAKTDARIWNNYDACCSAFIAGRAYAATLRQPSADSGRVGDEVRTAIRRMAGMLEQGEWADLLSTDPDVARLDAAISAALAAQGQGGPAGLYVEARQCEDCTHIGINDASETASACGDCEWQGPTPAEDKCPGCNSENCMAVACPICGGRYRFLVDRRLPASAFAQGRGVAVAWRIDTDDDVERVAKAAGWDNRRYMTPADYAVWCSRMREFVRLAAERPAPAASPAGVPDARIIDLAERLVASGPKAAHVSASECHEISDFILSLAAAPSAKPEEALGAAKAQFPAQYFVHAPIGPVGCCEKHMVALLGIYNFLGAHVAVTYAATGSTCVNCETEAAAETGERASGEA